MRRRDFILSISLAFAGRTAAQARPCPPALGLDGSPPPPVPCEDTPISVIANGLGAGQSSTALGDSGLRSSAAATIQWVNRFHYDHANGRAHLLGKNAASQGSQRSNSLYDAASNRWTSAVYGGSELGHVYESIAFDPQRVELYTGTWGQSRTLKRWSYGNNLDVWTNPATSPFETFIDPDVQPPLCWFPNAFGPGDGAVLALRTQAFANESVIAWRRSNDTWYTVPGTSHNVSGQYQGNGAIEYCRGGNFCIAAFPPSQGGRTFRIPAGANGALASAVQIDNVPIHCGYAGAGDRRGILLDDPAGSARPYILEKGGSNRVWKYNNGSWAAMGFTHPFPRGGQTSDTSWCVASCYPLGVFWAQDNDAGSPSRLWKPNS